MVDSYAGQLAREALLRKSRGVGRVGVPKGFQKICTFSQGETAKSKK